MAKWILIISLVNPNATKSISGFQDQKACDNAADQISMQWKHRYDNHVCVPDRILIPGSEK